MASPARVSNPTGLPGFDYQKSSSLYGALGPSRTPNTSLTPLETSYTASLETPSASPPDDQPSSSVVPTTELDGTETTGGPPTSTTSELDKKRWFCRCLGCEGRSYTDKRGAIDHYLAQHLNALFFCPVEGCGTGYPHFGSLRRHRLELNGGQHKEHLRGLRRAFPRDCTRATCPGLASSSEKDIEAHVEKYHFFLYGCPVDDCPEHFSTPAALRHHLYDHTALRKELEKFIVCD